MEIAGLRKVIGKRLSSEMVRKGIDIASLSCLSGLSKKQIEEILAGQSELFANNLEPLCDALNISLFRLLASDFKPIHLHPRSLNKVDKKNSAFIEEIFYLISDYLSNPKKVTYTTKISDFHDRLSIIEDAMTLAEKVRNDCGTTPENIIRTLHIPVIPIKLNNSNIDGCFLHSGEKSAIMLNTEKAAIRMRFTLAHEIAHFLFDKDKIVPFDQNINIFAESFDEESKPEFIATKFAQFLLVPVEILNKIFSNDNIDYGLAAKKCNELFVSREAMSFAIVDYALLLRKKIFYRDILENLNKYPRKNDENCFVEFLKSQAKKMHSILEQNKDDFSEDLICSLKKVIGF